MAEPKDTRIQVVQERAEDFGTWADIVSRRERRSFVRFKILQLAVAAAIPVAAAAQALSIVVAVLGAVVVLIQGVDQLFQWGRRYPATAEAAAEMRREKILWQTEAGAYAVTEDPARLRGARAWRKSNRNPLHSSVS